MTDQDPQSPRVAVLMAAFQAGEDLMPQLQSLLEQSLKPARIVISDDGSTDGTRARLKSFAAQAGRDGIAVTVTDGPRRGASANFLHLLGRPEAAAADYVALADQDDIWLPDKLRQAADLLAPHGSAPALLGTRSWEWDPATGRRHLSRPVPGPHDFRHALVQNFAGGNTMVLNRAGMALVQRAVPRVRDVAVHDWWLYQLISGAGGTILFGQEPQILYRQHPGNQIGANRGLGSKLARFVAMLRGTYRHWNDLNVAALMANADLLTDDSRALLERFARDRQGGLRARLALLRETGLHRKGRINHATLWLAALLKRL